MRFSASSQEDSDLEEGMHSSGKARFKSCNQRQLEVGGELGGYPVHNIEELRAKYMSPTQAVAQSTHDFAGGDGASFESDRQIMRDIWESYLGGVNRLADGIPSGKVAGLRKALRATTSDVIQGFHSRLQLALREICENGAIRAAGQAVQISDAFATSVAWNTYRATLGRAGDFTDSKHIHHDLNKMLADPMLQYVAAEWAALFETDIFKTIEAKVMDCIQILLRDMETTSPQSMKKPVNVQGQVCISEIAVAMEKLRTTVVKLLMRKQREASRPLALHVQESLRDIYERAKKVSGTGSRDRQKHIVGNFLRDESQDIFQECAALLIERLDEGVVESCDTLRTSIEDLASRVATSLSILWDGNDDFIKSLVPPPTYKNVVTGLLTPPATPPKAGEGASPLLSQLTSDSETAKSSTASPIDDVFEDVDTSCEVYPEAVSVVLPEFPGGFPLLTHPLDAIQASRMTANASPRFIATVVGFVVYVTWCSLFVIPASGGVA